MRRRLPKSRVAIFRPARCLVIGYVQGFNFNFYWLEVQWGVTGGVLAESSNLRVCHPCSFQILGNVLQGWPHLGPS